MTRLPLLALTLLLAALVSGSLASCGGGEDATAKYDKSFAPVNRDIQTIGSRVEAAVRGAEKMKNDAEIAATFAALSTDASYLAGALVVLTPPKDLVDEQQALVGGLRAASGSLARISRAAIDGDADAAGDATREVQKSAGEIRVPRQKIVAALTGE